MARRRNRNESEAIGLVARLALLLAFLAGPATATWFNQRPWALPLAAATGTFGLMGLLLFSLALRQIRKQEAEKRRLLEQNWGRLSDKEFEHYVAGLFRARGWQATVVGGTADGGVDIQLRRNGQNGLVQVKQYLSGRAVSVNEVREFAAVINRAGANEGFFVTAGSFTRPALDWAKAEPMTLVNGNDLAQWAEETRQDIAMQPAQSGFSLVQWLVLVLLVATACAVFSFIGAVLAWG
ncbi:MAG: hypothetical protein FOGNACKC_06117 [Anaerolineae bacterium]|nr:hypothetical protein [Anaerolineae bacterium]